MFEIGKYYNFTTIHSEEYYHFDGKIIDYQHPLVKYEDEKGVNSILNASSPAFFEAHPTSSPEELKAAHEKFEADFD